MHAQAGGQGAYTGELYSGPHRFDVPMQEAAWEAPAPGLCSRRRAAAEMALLSPDSRLCFVALCLTGSSSARRFNRIVSGIEEDIETRCSIVHGRSPASAKAGDHIKLRRAIVRDQIPASGI